MVSSLVPSPGGGAVDLPFRDFKADRALGRSSLYGDVANAAAQKYCALFNKSPASVARLIPFGSGLIDNSRGIFDDMCEPTDLPPLPTPPFTGGQCACQDYQVSYQTTVDDGPFGSPVTFVTKGPIGAPTIKSDDPTVLGFTRGSAACALPYFAIFSGNREEIARGRFKVINFQAVAVSGSDLCGNPAPTYPNPTAGPSDLQGTTIINVSPNVPVTVPVTIIPTFAPITGIFRPEFNVDVGGINVNISTGGFTFSPTLEIEPNVNVPISDPRSAPPSALPIRPPSGSSGSNTDLTPVTDLLRKVREKQEECCPSVLPPEADPIYLYKTVSSADLESGSIALPPLTYKVRVLLQKTPNNEKTQSGGTQSNVVYSGWAWFGSQGSLGPRRPIDSRNKQFIPENTSQNSFVWTCYVNQTAIVTVYYKEKK